MPEARVAQVHSTSDTSDSEKKGFVYNYYSGSFTLLSCTRERKKNWKELQFTLHTLQFTSGKRKITLLPKYSNYSMLLYYQYSNSLWMIKWYTRTHTHCLLLLLLHTTTTTVDPLDPAPFNSWPPGPAPVPLKSKKTLPALNNYYELYIIIRKIFILVLPILPNSNNTKKTSNGRQKVSFFLFDDKLITTKLRKRRKKNEKSWRDFMLLRLLWRENTHSHFMDTIA